MGRAVIGAIAGATLGTVVWLGLESFTGRNLEWLVLLVGVLAGLGVRLLCKQRSSMTGVVATTMALCGIIGGNIAQPFILEMIYNATSNPVPSAVKIDDVDRSDDDEAASDRQESSTSQLDPASSVPAVDALRQSAPYYLGEATGAYQSSSQVLELAMYVISAILAYLLGAGSKQSVPAVESVGATD